MTRYMLDSVNDLLRMEQTMIRNYQDLAASCSDQQLKIMLEKLEARHRLQYDRLLQQLN